MAQKVWPRDMENNSWVGIGLSPKQLPMFAWLDFRAAMGTLSCVTIFSFYFVYGVYPLFVSSLQVGCEESR